MSIVDPARTTTSPPPTYFSRRVLSARRYYLDLAPPESTPLAVICGGYEECAPDYAIRRDDFPHYVLEWVVSGRGRVRLGGRWCELEAGVLFSYGPGASHQIETDAEHPLAKHFVSFSGRDASRLLQATGLPAAKVSGAPRGADLPWLFEALLRVGSQGEPSDRELCASLLRYLLKKIAASPATQQSGGARSTFERCDAYLVEHIADLRSLSDLADACDVDPTYLCRLYQRYSQQSPYQRLLHLRMHRVASQLADDHRPLRQIAAELGFDDPFLLSRQFKKVFGVSPSQFRTLR